MGILQEYEKDWGQPRDMWSTDQWETVALAIADGVNHPEEDNVRTVLLEYLKAENRELKAMVAELLEFAGSLSEEVVKHRNRRVGRPKNPAHTTYQGALAAALLNYKPKRSRGRPAESTPQDQALIVEHFDRLKAEGGFKTDKETVAAYCKNLPVRTRATSIEKLRKLLSRLRKSVPKIAE